MSNSKWTPESESEKLKLVNLKAGFKFRSKGETFQKYDINHAQLILVYKTRPAGEACWTRFIH